MQAIAVAVAKHMNRYVLEEAARAVIAICADDEDRKRRAITDGVYQSLYRAMQHLQKLGMPESDHLILVCRRALEVVVPNGAAWGDGYVVLPAEPENDAAG